jgi:hypothetical protein
MSGVQRDHLINWTKGIDEGPGPQGRQALGSVRVGTAMVGGRG